MSDIVAHTDNGTVSEIGRLDLRDKAGPAVEQGTVRDA
jgi:hypothetical protein